VALANSTRPLINLMMLPTFNPIEPLPRFLNEPVDRDKVSARRLLGAEGPVVGPRAGAATSVRRDPRE
jgi:hypothetical protein